MPTNRKILADLLTAPAALLACSSGIDFHNLYTGTLSLVFQDAQKAGPTGITDSPGQPVIPQHSLDVKAFHSDQAIG